MLALIVFWHEPGYALEPAQILSWVAEQMEITDTGPLPAAFYVSKAGLQAAFTKANRHTFQITIHARVTVHDSFARERQVLIIHPTLRVGHG